MAGLFLSLTLNHWLWQGQTSMHLAANCLCLCLGFPCLIRGIKDPMQPTATVLLTGTDSVPASHSPRRSYSLAPAAAASHVRPGMPTHCTKP